MNTKTSFGDEKKIFAVQMDDRCPVKITEFPKTGFENAFDMHYIISSEMLLPGKKIIIVDWD